MLRNHLLITLRNIQRQKLFSLVNLAGLSLGLSAAMLIFLFVANEVSYDRFHQHADRIYRIGMWDKSPSGISNSAKSCAPLLEAVSNALPEVEDGTRFGIWKDIPITIGQTISTAPAVWVADSNFFSFFTLALIHGDKKTALREMNKVVLTKSAARKYFGHENPVGETFEMNIYGSKRNVEITAVAQDPPANSHLQFELIVSGESWKYLKNHYWLNAQNYTYVRTREVVEPKMFDSRIRAATDLSLAKDISNVLGHSMEKFRADGGDLGFFSQPLTKIHLHSSVEDEIVPNGNVQHVYIFSAAALLILILAIVNYVNLYTARSTARAKEVGIRKVSGAASVKLCAQFVTESILFVVIAAIIAIAICGLMLPLLNTYIAKDLSPLALLTPRVLALFVAALVIIGIIAGAYPAFYLSRFQPSDVLKGKIRTGLKTSGFRNYLVVFQFTVTLILITASVVMFNQLTYMSKKELGFKQENVVVVRKADQLGINSGAFIHELRSYPEVFATSFSNAVPPEVNETGGFRLPGSEKDFTLAVLQADAGVLSALGLNLLDGRFFSDDRAFDSSAVLLNESAMKLLGWDKVGNQRLTTYFRGLEPRELQLIGVVQDFHYRKLYDEIRPMAILPGPRLNSVLSIRIQSEGHSTIIPKLEEAWKKYTAGGTLDYIFLDDTLKKAYERDRQNARVIVMFTFLSIVIAGLGLYGLASYVIEQRTKEMSIRKVMGASPRNVLLLLNSEFIRLVLVAITLSVPSATWLMNRWLEAFPYRQEIQLPVMVLPGLLVLLLTLLLVSLHGWRAARLNPTVFLRAE